MPLLKEIKLDEGLLALWQIDEDIDTLIQLVAEKGIEKELKAIKNKRRKKEWLAVRLLLKKVGCKNLSVSYNHVGQPKISHEYYQHISISHSNKLAGIILHPSSVVGLDIECIDRNYESVKHKYLSPYELEMTGNNENGLALFWCAKEAVYKAAGVPGVHFANQIQLKNIDKTSLMADFIQGNTTKSYRLSYFLHQDQLICYLIDQ